MLYIVLCIVWMLNAFHKTFLISIEPSLGRIVFYRVFLFWRNSAGLLYVCTLCMFVKHRLLVFSFLLSGKPKLVNSYCWNGVSAFSVLWLALAIAFGSMVASRNLHSGLLLQVLRCPMSFFDTTPLGRIVNRFSKDIDILDTNIPQFTQNFLITFAPLVSTIIVISYSTPIFISVAIPLILIFIVIQVITETSYILRLCSAISSVTDNYHSGLWVCTTDSGRRGS